MKDATIRVQHQLTIRSHVCYCFVDPAIQLLVKNDGVGPVLHQRIVRLDPVGDIGVAKNPAIEHQFQTSRMIAHGGLEQFDQVDDLVIAPIPDVCPRIMR